MSSTPSADPDAKSRQDRFDHGMEVLSRIDGEGGRKVIDSLADISPELGHQVVAWAFGDIYDRPGLAPPGPPVGHSRRAHRARRL